MTDPFAQINAAVDAAHQQVSAELAADAVQHAADVAQHQADQQALAADEAEIAELEAELHPVPPGPVPGVNATSTAQHATQSQVWGLPVQPWCWRYYLQSGEPLHLPTEYALGPGEQLVISNGSPPQNLTLGQLVAFFKSIPAGVTVYFCVRHEPEPKIDKGEFTSAQLKAAWHVARLAQQQVGNPNIKLVVILTGYAWSAHRNVEDYIPADADFDLLTSDTYFNGSAGQIGRDISTAAAQFDAQIATATAHGVPWGITETGIGRGLAGQDRLDALTTLAKTIKAKGAVLGLYFDQGQTTDEWWLDPSGVAAWKAGLAS